MSRFETGTLRNDTERLETQQMKFLRPLVNNPRRDRLHNKVIRSNWEKPVLLRILRNTERMGNSPGKDRNTQLLRWAFYYRPRNRNNIGRWQKKLLDQFWASEWAKVASFLVREMKKKTMTVWKLLHWMIEFQNDDI